MINVFKASAGSGKTYTLTNRYISLLGNEDEYKHILAVTFTNKATDEMKQRVLKELAKRAEANDSLAYNTLIKILHDYSNFTITTIDSFFQQVMRAFAREIGQNASYNVELDEDRVLQQAVDTMLDSLEDKDNATLLKWLENFAVSNIRSGRSWNIREELVSMGRLFLKEDFKVKKRSCGTETDIEILKSVRNMVEGIISNFRNELKSLGTKALSVMASMSLKCSDFKGGSRSPFFCFDTWSHGIISRPCKSFDALSLSDFEEWFSKGNYSPAYSEGLERLRDCIIAAETLFDLDYPVYKTADILSKNVYLIGIFNDLYASILDVLRENNIVMLNETSETLNDIIDGSDTPFIYEKLGNRYDHLMLDEFQDTSVIQWSNFKPLFDNSNAQGFSNLIVGDVKQSIYRWRGSDWNTLAHGLSEDFSGSELKMATLSSNWRSCRNIVEFNNAVFPKLVGKLNDDRISDLYGDVVQEIPDSRIVMDGHVSLSFVETDRESDEETGWHGTALMKMVDSIEKLRHNGFPLCKINILVRTNREGSEAASYLIRKGYNVITEDSLTASHSANVCKIVALLSSIANADDSINSFVLKEMGIEGNIIAKENSLYGLCEDLIRRFVTDTDGDVPYLNAFMDKVREYNVNNGSNLSGFLSWWKDNSESVKIFSPEGSDAIRVMTIHKSKGLSLDAVILPFFQGKLNPGGGLNPHYFWSVSPAPFEKLGVVPVVYKKDLEDSLFREDYQKEGIYIKVDALNTAYVALTRARQELVIIAHKPKEGKNGFSMNTLSDYMFDIFKGDYESGKFAEYMAEDKDDDPVIQEESHSFLSIPIGSERLKLSLRGGDFFEEENNRVRGIVMHDILSSIDCLQDIDRAVLNAVSSGELPSDMRDNVTEQISSLVESVASRHWFDGTYTSYNELSIILPGGEVERPDRVLTDGMKAIVIDYKFGKPYRSHERQVAKYVSYLLDMGFSDVEGYLWYASDKTIMPVGKV